MLGFSCTSAETEWKILYGWTSGWGYESGIYLDSKGITGKTEHFNHESLTACKNIVLNKKEIKNIERLLLKIPNSIPGNSHLKIKDHCADETEHAIFIIKLNQERAFSYSKNEDCINKEDVPIWLTNLARFLEKQYSKVMQCEYGA